MAEDLDLGGKANGRSPILVAEDRDANSPQKPAIEALIAHG
jgi:hypothetical protein